MKRLSLDEMYECGSITPMEALDYDIRTEMVEGHDGKRWAMYRLEPVQVEMF